MSKTSKILAYFFAVLTILGAVLLYFEASMKGFPDGHLTELDRAEQPLFYVTSILSLMTGLFLFSLARFKKFSRTNRAFYKTLLFLLLTVLITISIEGYFITTLDNGMGG